MIGVKNHSSVGERRLRNIYDFLEAKQYKKAVNEAEKIINKQKGDVNVTCHALLAVGLVCSGQRKRGIKLANELIADGKLNDENAAHALAKLFYEINDPRGILKAWQATSNCIETEDVFREVFSAAIAVDDFPIQQKAAVMLHKRWQAEKYIWWRATSLVMQAKYNPLLAHKLCYPVAMNLLSGKPKTENEKALLSKVYQAVGKTEEALELESLNHPQTAEVLLNCGKYQEAFEELKTFIDTSKNFHHWQLYLKCCKELGDSFVEEAITKLKSVEIDGREGGVCVLSTIQYTKQLGYSKLCDGLTQPNEIFKILWNNSGHKPSFVHDIVSCRQSFEILDTNFIKLDELDFDRLVNIIELRRRFDIEMDDETATEMILNKLPCIDCNKTEVSFGVRTVALLFMKNCQKSPKKLINSMVLLTRIAPYDRISCLILLNLVKRFAPELWHKVYGQVSLKHIQSDALPLFPPQCFPIATRYDIVSSVLKSLEDGVKDSNNLVFGAYNNLAYGKVEDSLNLRDSLRSSATLEYCAAEKHLLHLLASDTPKKLTDTAEEIQEKYILRSNNRKLMDNRDKYVFGWNEDKDRNISFEKWLNIIKMKRLIINLIVNLVLTPDNKEIILSVVEDLQKVISEMKDSDLAEEKFPFMTIDGSTYNYPPNQILNMLCSLLKLLSDQPQCDIEQVKNSIDESVERLKNDATISIGDWLAIVSLLLFNNYVYKKIKMKAVRNLFKYYQNVLEKASSGLVYSQELSEELYSIKIPECDQCQQNVKSMEKAKLEVLRALKDNNYQTDSKGFLKKRSLYIQTLSSNRAS
ncbi:DgyrCDS5786 [Dimorphilus gyrociliatus]|uniref:DgyrCDS5786 n=1 Tax=Dimorphilus gyrociliatus TaxID=2664684 RepID=A0A7I8VN97_9ANNE|nr:DgyrCDS5786 [Dimorphilus gyrociliatus]